MTALPVRFWAKVDKSAANGCWNWTAARLGGYGRFNWCPGRSHLAHRLAFEDQSGPVPAGLVLDHLCRNRGCVNPTHLEVVTPQENSLRGIGVGAVNAAKTHCPQGHPYDEVNTYVWPKNPQHRQCWTCLRDRVRTMRAAGKAVAA